MKTDEILKFARQHVDDSNYEGLKEIVLNAKGNSQAINRIADMVHGDACFLIENSFYEDLGNLLDAVKASPLLQKVIFDELQDDLTSLLRSHDIADFETAYALCEKYGYADKALTKEAIEEGVKDLFKVSYLCDVPEILESVKSCPPLEPILADAIKREYDDLTRSGHLEKRADLLTTIKKYPRILQCVEPNSDIFHIPTSDKTHDWPITIVFDRKDGSMSLQSGCLEKTSLPDLKYHWNEHSKEQRRQRALPLVVTSLKAIARGHFPKHASAAVVEDAEKLSGHARKQLVDAGYKAPAFKGTMA